MQKILGIEGLAIKMDLSKGRIYTFLDSGRIVPDFLDDKGRCFWRKKTAERLAQKRQEQADLPRHIRRDFFL